MTTSLQFIVPVLLLLTGVIVTGNYMVNQKQGMRSIDNLQETRMWGAGFFLYAVFDYLMLLL